MIHSITRIRSPRRLQIEYLEDRRTPAAAIAGFNDAVGINSDPTPNSPYSIGGQITGQGVGEPGWAGTWVQSIGNPGDVVIQSNVVYEGDGALQVLGGTTGAIRDWLNGPSTGSHLVTQYVYVPPGGAVAQYLQDSTIIDTATATAAQWRGVASTGTGFEVLDSGFWEDTGIPVPVNTWVRVDIVVDMTARTYDFYINGQKYNAPDPIGFRGNPGILNRANYFITNTPGFYADAFSVQPVVPVTVTINQASTQADAVDTGPIFFDVVFSEPVTGFAPTDVDLSASTTPGNLTASVVESGPMDGTTYTVGVTGMLNDGIVIARLPAGAAQGGGISSSIASTSTDNSVTFFKAPSATIAKAAGQNDPAAHGPITFIVNFNENVSGFTADDVDLSLSSLDGLSAAVTQITPASYSVAVTGMVGQGTVVANVPAGAAFDSLNAPSTAATFTDNTVAYDGFGGLTLTTTAFTATEGGANVTVKVVRTGGFDNAISFDYSFTGITAEASDFSVSPASSGSLAWLPGESDEKTFVVTIVNDDLSETQEIISVALTSIVGGTADVANFTLSIARSDPKKVDASTRFRQTFVDEDGDRVTVKLTGGSGAVDFYLTDGTGPIAQMTVSGTNPTTSNLSVMVQKAGKPAVSDDRIDIGFIQGSGLKSIFAPKSNLVGTGIDLAGNLTKLTIGNIEDGADVFADGAFTQTSRVSTQEIGNGTVIDLGNRLGRFTAKGVGNSQIIAPSVDKFIIDGDFSGDLIVTGQGINHVKGHRSLNAFTVKGAVDSAEIRVIGNIGSVTSYEFRNSVLYGGFSGPPDNAFDPVHTTLNTFRTLSKSGYTGTFENSSIYAFGINFISLADVKTDNGGNGEFGVYVQNFYKTIAFSVNGTTTKTKDSASFAAVGNFDIDIV